MVTDGSAICALRPNGENADNGNAHQPDLGMSLAKIGLFSNRAMLRSGRWAGKVRSKRKYRILSTIIRSRFPYGGDPAFIEQTVEEPPHLGSENLAVPFVLE